MPQPGYPQYPPGYPQAPYGQPAQPPMQQPAQPPAAAQPTQPGAVPTATAEPAKLTWSAANEEAKAALAACFDAADNYRAEQARARCTEALNKDAQLALAHVLLAQVAPTAGAAKKRIFDANEALARRPLPEGERLLAEALLAGLEDRHPAAQASLDALVALLPGEKRAFHYRGLWRYRVGRLDAAQADFEKATQIDGKFGPAWNALGHLNVRRDKLDDAQKAFEKYVEVAPKEANAYDSLASLHLRRGNLNAAVETARKAVELDAKFLKANARLGDALLFQGNAAGARRAYAALMTSPDPAEHHDGAMRSARSHLFEAQGAPNARLIQNAEKELSTEADVARKLDRKADLVHALTELCRMQIERGALTDAGHTATMIRDILDDKPIKTETKTDAKPVNPAEKKADAAADGAADKGAVDKSAPTLTMDERLRYGGELLVLRALLLSAVGETALAEERADELEKLWRPPVGLTRARELRGDLAARSGDREGVVKLLDPLTTTPSGGDAAAAAKTMAAMRPLPRLALGYALGGGKPGEPMDGARARALMEDLAKRNVNDLEGALSRGRARGWLKQNPADKGDKTDK